MSFLDVFLTVLFVGVVWQCLGLLQGTVRQSLLIAAFYLSLLIAGVFFPIFGAFIEKAFGGLRFMADYTSFALLFGISFALLAGAVWYAFDGMEVAQHWQLADHIGGLCSGVVLGVLLVGFTTVFTWNLSLQITAAGDLVTSPLAGLITSGVHGSFLVQHFGENIMPQTYGVIAPLLPGESRVLFAATALQM